MCVKNDEKASGCYKQNKLQVIDEYNERKRTNEPKVDDTYKRWMNKAGGKRNKGKRQDGKRSEMRRGEDKALNWNKTKLCENTYRINVTTK